MDIISNLTEIDFSKNSKVKESLYKELLANRGKVALDDEALDQVIAAGANIRTDKPEL